MEKKEIEKLANDHWKYTQKIGKMMYIEAFIHGLKHNIMEENKMKNIKEYMNKQGTVDWTSIIKDQHKEIEKLTNAVRGLTAQNKAFFDILAGRKTKTIK